MVHVPNSQVPVPPYVPFPNNIRVRHAYGKMQLHFVELATFLVRNKLELVPTIVVLLFAFVRINDAVSADFCELWLQVTFN